MNGLKKGQSQITFRADATVLGAHRMLLFARLSAAPSLFLMFTSVLFVYPSPIVSIPYVDAINRNIVLDGGSSGWNSTTPTPNPSINVVQGDMITLSLSSEDRALHKFYIDIDGNGDDDCPQEKCSANFGGGLPLSTTFSLDVDFAPGDYTYYCPYHQQHMSGTLLVQGFTIDSSSSSLRVVQGFSNTSTITVTSVNSFSGLVSLSAPISPSGPTTALSRPSVTLSPGGAETLTLTVSTTGGTALGNYVVYVTGTSGSAFGTRSVATMVVGPDFDISASPVRLEVPVGSARSSTITLVSLDSFFENIDLSTSPPPLGITASFSPNPVPLPSGGTATSTLDVAVSSAAINGTYMVDVTGTSGFLRHTTTIAVVAGWDYGVALNPAALTLTPGSSDILTITLTSFNGFLGTVDLTGAVSPGGPSFSLSRQSVSLSGGESATAVLAVNASATTVPGVYAITITATSGSSVHSVPITVSVVDFSITVSNTNLLLQQGSSITTTISLTSINGFAGDVNLTVAASTSTLSRLLNATTLSLNPSVPRVAILTVSAASAPAGTYTISITGTSGVLARSISVNITVQPPPGGASILPMVAGGVAGAIAVAVAATYLLIRRKPPRRDTNKLGFNTAS